MTIRGARARRATSLIALTSAAALLLTGCALDLGSSGGAASSDGCTQIVVATSSEKVNLMEDLGAKFKESSEHAVLADCATVRPVNVASGKAAT